MEKLFYNLEEEEFTKGRKIVIWGVSALFICGGIYVAMLSPVFGKHSVSPALSIPPLAIGVLFGTIAAFASIKREDLFFLIDDDKIEFRYGLFRPKKYSFPWTNIKKIVMPRKERKAKLLFKDNTSFVIDISYLQRKKSTLIRKHIFHAARNHNIDVIKVITLAHHKAHAELHNHTETDHK